MLTSRDKRIIKFMEELNLGLTIQQAGQIFFPRKFAYDYARQRLKILHKDYKIIKKYKNTATGEIIYYLDKKPTYHNNAVLNAYSNFIAAGYNIAHFKHEQQWMEGKYRSDGFLIAENYNEIRMVIIEVDYSSPTNIQKYEELYEVGELQQKYGDFPMVLILSDIERTYQSKNFTIVNLDIRCTEFNKVLY